MKKLLVPEQLLAVSALLEHLPANHPKRSVAEDDFAKRYAGWRGEQNLSYYLSHLPQNSFSGFHDLRLSAESHLFQMDMLMITFQFILIIEVKNFAGSIYFDTIFNQLIRVHNEHKEGFSNPIIQVHRHRKLLMKWLAIHRLSSLPIECLVVIANPSTLIDTARNSRNIGEIVCHAEQIESKIEQLTQKHKSQKISESNLNRVENLLLKEHIDPLVNICDTFSVSDNDLIRGVKCPFCHSFRTSRVYGSWFCPQCGNKTRTAHEQNILEYFLLNDKKMTNGMCQDFLNINNRQLATRLLQKMQLKTGGSGQGIGQYYLAPSLEFYDQHFQLWKKNR